MNMDYKKVESKVDLLRVIQSLVEEDPSKWENVTTMQFLEALGAWLEDSDGFYSNFNLQTDSEKASWQLFSDALQAATIYE